MAVALTGDLLPLPVQSWLSAMEQHKLVAASILGHHPPVTPTLTDRDKAIVAQVKSLSEVLLPARERGTELEKALSTNSGAGSTHKQFGTRSFKVSRTAASISSEELPKAPIRSRASAWAAMGRCWTTRCSSPFSEILPTSIVLCA